jgi:hypothetical protein
MHNAQPDCATTSQNAQYARADLLTIAARGTAHACC